MPRRRYCPAGFNEAGRPVYVDHETGEARSVSAAPTDGKALAPGRGLALISPDDDGVHVVMEDVVSPGGPAQVATPAYRSGWEQTFGSKPN